VVDISVRKNASGNGRLPDAVAGAVSMWMKLGSGFDLRA